MRNWNEREHGMRVNIVAPGLVDTDMGRKLITLLPGPADREPASVPGQTEVNVGHAARLGVGHLVPGYNGGDAVDQVGLDDVEGGLPPLLEAVRHGPDRLT